MTSLWSVAVTAAVFETGNNVLARRDAIMGLPEASYFRCLVLPSAPEIQYITYGSPSHCEDEDAKAVVAAQEELSGLLDACAWRVPAMKRRSDDENLIWFETMTIGSNTCTSFIRVSDCDSVVNIFRAVVSEASFGVDQVHLTCDSDRHLIFDDSLEGGTWTCDDTVMALNKSFAVRTELSQGCDMTSLTTTATLALATSPDPQTSTPEPKTTSPDPQTSTPEPKTTSSSPEPSTTVSECLDVDTMAHVIFTFTLLEPAALTPDIQLLFKDLAFDLISDASITKEVCQPSVTPDMIESIELYLVPANVTKRQARTYGTITYSSVYVTVYSRPGYSAYALYSAGQGLRYMNQRFSPRDLLDSDSGCQVEGSCLLDGCCDILPAQMGDDNETSNSWSSFLEPRADPRLPPLTVGNVAISLDAPATTASSDDGNDWWVRWVIAGGVVAALIIILAITMTLAVKCRQETGGAATTPSVEAPSRSDCVLVTIPPPCVNTIDV